MARPREHHCVYREELAVTKQKLAETEQKLTETLGRVSDLETKLASLLDVSAKMQAELGSLKRRFLGKSTERLPTPESELKKQGREANKPRGKNRSRAGVPAIRKETVVHPVAEDACKCPHCGGLTQPIGHGAPSVVYDYIPGVLVEQTHLRETRSCACKQYIVRAEVPDKVFDRTQFGPGLVAYLAVAKCADSLPLYRVEKHFARSGIPLARNTMGSLVLRAGEVLVPLWRALLGEITAERCCQADETSCRVQQRDKRAFVWTFLAGPLTAYVYSPDRSGQTPADVLGGTTGTLVVDGYTGYNNVTDVDGRDRAGCWSHARRYFFEALPTAPQAREALDIILEVFDVERKAKSRGVVGTAEHLRLRQERSAKAIDRLYDWAEQQLASVEPKSPLATAIRYLVNQRQPLTLCLQDANVPVHNNASEAALRVIALGRKNFLFFGHDAAARSFMVLYSLIATCERVGVNPVEYLADVLLRVQSHPQSRVAELLPHRWKPPASASVLAA